jgi:hypothetical protein
MLSKTREKIQKVRFETGEKAAQLFNWLNSQKKNLTQPRSASRQHVQVAEFVCD